jgi:type II secretory pathway component PulC
MAVALRTARRFVACALVLAMAAGPAAGESQRLAATLLTPGHAAALVELSGEPAWLYPGESAGECRLLRVEATAADLECNGRDIRLTLEPGTARPEIPAPDPALASVELPPGALRSLAARPQAIALAGDFAPEVVHGRLLGWRVARLDENGALARVGLREADVIHAIDGAPAGEPAAFAAAIRALPTAHAFTLELSRDSRPLTLLVSAPPTP